MPARALSAIAIASAIACGTLLEVGDAPDGSDGGPDASGADGDVGDGAGCAVSITPTSLNLGELFRNERRAASVLIRNSGTSETTVSAVIAPPFDVQPSTVTLPAAAEAQLAVSFVADAGVTAFGRLELTSAGCGLVSVPVAATVVAGQYAVSPGSFALSGPCGGAATALPLQIRTTSAGATIWSASASPPSLAVEVVPDGGSVPGSSQFDASVRATGPLPEEPGDAGAGTISLLLVSEPPARALPVWLTAYGAKLSASKPFINLSSKTPRETLILANVGNAAATVTVKLTGAFRGTPGEGSSVTLGPGGATLISVEARGTPSSGTLTFATNDPLCGPAPAVSLSYQ